MRVQRQALNIAASNKSAVRGDPGQYNTAAVNGPGRRLSICEVRQLTNWPRAKHRRSLSSVLRNGLDINSFVFGRSTNK